MGLLAGLLWGIGGPPALGQSSADAFFHEAAQRYVAGDTEAARRAVERGLERDPSDPRLQALRRTLERQREQRGGGRSSQQGQEGRNQRDPSEGMEGQREQSEESGQEGPPQSDATADRESSPGQKSGSSSGGSAGNGAQAGRSSDQTSEHRPPRSLSRAQAARLLRALENQEQKLLREVQGQTDDPQSVEKDW
jgi:hypothetical protein